MQFFFKIFIVKRFVCREALFRSNVVKDKIKMKEKVFQEFCLHYLVTVSSCFLHTHITGLGTLECMLIVLGPNPRVEFENISSKPASKFSFVCFHNSKSLLHYHFKYRVDLMFLSSCIQ